MGLRPRVVAGAVAAAVLLTGCDETPEDRARRLAVAAARRHNAVAGAAIALLVVLAVRHLAALRAEPARGWGAYRGPARLPGPLAAAALSSEVAGMLLLALVGAAAGYVFGRTPPGPSTDLDSLGIALAVVFLGPVVVVVGLVGMWLVQLPKRLPDVATSRFFWAAFVHVLAGAYGLSLAADARRPVDGWHAFGAVLAAAGLAGAAGYGYAVAVRRRQRKAFALTSP